MREIVKRLVGPGGLFRTLRRLRMRWLCLRHGLKHVHPTAYISTLAGVEIARDVRLAEFVYVGNGCVIGRNVSIGRYTMLAPRVSIVGADHRMDVPGRPMIFAGRPEQKPTVIGDDAWIGVGAVVMQGVTIGRGAVIGANAIVTKDVPPYEIWVGIPARRISERFGDAEARRRHDAMLDGPVVDPDYCS
jgi:acetyltransferase-like isoleucine patch superfamily enzyme